VRALLILLLLPLAGWGQQVKLPFELKVERGRLVQLAIEYDGDDVKWIMPRELDAFREYDPDPKKIRLRILAPAATKDGTYDLIAIAVKAGKLSEFARCSLVVGDGPKPPDPPVPPVPPDPVVVPLPVKGALIIFETAEAPNLPEKQQQILYGQTTRDYLNSKCAVEADGKTKAWRIYDKDIATDADLKVWQDAMKRPRKSVPWLIVSDGAKKGFEGPLPATVEDALVIFKKILEG
jgi:hypothetical protein